MSRIELNKAFVELLSPKIVLVTTKDNVVIEVKDIEEIKEANTEITKGNKYGAITYTGKYSSVTNEAREHIANNRIEKNRIATAFVIDSLSQRILLRFFIQINKPSMPTKIFTSIKSAKVWMDAQIKNFKF